MIELAWEMNKKIAETMGLAIIEIDQSLPMPGRWLIDPAAAVSELGSTSTCLVGGSWQQIKNSAGLEKFWGRPCPNWAGDWRETGALIERYQIELRRSESSPYWRAHVRFEQSGLVYEDPKLAVCAAWIRILNREKTGR